MPRHADPRGRNDDAPAPSIARPALHLTGEPRLLVFGSPGPGGEPFCRALEVWAADRGRLPRQPGRRPGKRRRDGLSLFGRRRRCAGGKHVGVLAAALLQKQRAENPALELRSAQAPPRGAMGRLEGRGERT
jgi:hypothetical protein